MLTPEQRERRRYHLGGSDLPNLLGCGFGGRDESDLFLEKKGELEELNVRELSPIDLGNYLEPVTLSLFERQYDIEVQRDVEVCQASEDWLVVHLDGLILRGPGEPVEAKFSGQAEAWGEELTDDIPDRVLVQVNAELIATGPECQIAWVPVLVPKAFQGLDFRIYRVEADRELQEIIKHVGRRFYERCIRQGLPPEHFAPQLETIKRARRKAESVTSLKADAIQVYDRLEGARLAKGVAEAHEKRCYADMLALLQDKVYDRETGEWTGEWRHVERGLLPNGRELTYRSQKSARSCDFDLLRARWPEAYAACVEQGDHRVLRLLKPKKQGTKLRR